MILAVLQSSVILLVAFAVVQALRGQSAAIRHLTLILALSAAIVVPVIGRLLPKHAQGHGLYARVQDETETLLKLEVGIGIRPADAKAFQPPPRPDFPFALVVWAFGASLTAAFLLTGLVRITLLTRRARLFVVPSFLMSRRIRIFQNDRAVLGTYGIFHPRVFLPHDADRWSGDRLRLVLTHELAHIQRCDWLVQMLAEAARIVYWFNPLFWVLCRRLRAESELACDDIVLKTGVNPNDYAAHLLDLARSLRSSAPAWSPILAMAKAPLLERRFVAMLNPSVNRNPVSQTALLIAFSLTLLVSAPIAAVRAEEQTKPTISAPQIITAPAVVSVVKSASPASAKTPVIRAAPKHSPTQGLADGSLTGSVSDGSSAFVPGVTLTVSSRTSTRNTVRDSEVQSTVSNEIGRYRFAALTPGQYWLKAEFAGFMTFRTVVQIERGQISTQNVTLSVGTIQQHVIVTAMGQPKPAPPAGVPQRIRVGGNVIAANLVSQVKPVYPESARDVGIEGTVHLQGLIGTEGTLVGVTPLNNIDPDLTASALDAVRQWRYKPTLLNGVPVEVLTTIDVEFKLAQ